ncbi:MAG: hypothetical protein QOJ39_2576 [Candidatus Eremiobacteraeota bacterium]|nr:hypothetical protein [Candidatus Eremiobacteraeota bacterium]MEA2720712.1 hypothetical protein [Candidatus Eremiobacteraeota bacterium]
MIRRLLVVALLVAAASCGHKDDTQTTSTTTTTGANAGTAATPSGAMSAKGMNGTTTGGSVNTGAHQPPGFDTETAAQGHCPTDNVVWLNTNSRVYHLKGQVYYGHTKVGAYVCKKEADSAGDRETQNGK